MEQQYYTPAGYQALLDELHDLVNVKIEQNKKDISTARSYGDLSENSEYDEAKQEQGILHARKLELEELIRNAIIIDESELDPKKISVGSVVAFYNVERKTVFRYSIVGSYETDPANGKISDSSPIGAALIGKREGETALVNGIKPQHLEIFYVARNVKLGTTEEEMKAYNEAEKAINDAIAAYQVK